MRHIRVAVVGAGPAGIYAADILTKEADEAGGIWLEGVQALRGVFSSTTIADIARREAEAGAGMYYI